MEWENGMEMITIKDVILAIVTIKKHTVSGEAVPVFYGNDETEAQQICTYLSRALDGFVHSLDNGVYFIVKH